tara:strand:- start:14821 stop:15060 length:240 start_codon:yes stop_codon:yes gene_type:complete
MTWRATSVAVRTPTRWETRDARNVLWERGGLQFWAHGVGAAAHGDKRNAGSRFRDAVGGSERACRSQEWSVKPIDCRHG